VCEMAAEFYRTEAWGIKNLEGKILAARSQSLAQGAKSAKGRCVLREVTPSFAKERQVHFARPGRRTWPGKGSSFIIHSRLEFLVPQGTGQSFRH